MSEAQAFRGTAHPVQPEERRLRGARGLEILPQTREQIPESGWQRFVRGEPSGLGLEARDLRIYRGRDVGIAGQRARGGERRDDGEDDHDGRDGWTHRNGSSVLYARGARESLSRIVTGAFRERDRRSVTVQPTEPAASLTRVRYHFAAGAQIRLPVEGGRQ